MPHTKEQLRTLDEIEQLCADIVSRISRLRRDPEDSLSGILWRAPRILRLTLEGFPDNLPGNESAAFIAAQDIAGLPSEFRQDSDELEYLRWFFANADFGPADSDVRAYMDEAFIEETGKALPAGYEPEES